MDKTTQQVLDPPTKMVTKVFHKKGLYFRGILEDENEIDLFRSSLSQEFCKAVLVETKDGRLRFAHFNLSSLGYEIKNSKYLLTRFRTKGLLN